MGFITPTDTPGGALNKVMAEDTLQITRALTGVNDPGGITFSGQSAASGAPSVALQAGGLTGTYGWAAYWITGSLDGRGGYSRNGTTAAGTALTGQVLSSQEAVASPPGSPPQQAIGWGLCRTKAGGGTYYAVAEVFLPTYGASWTAPSMQITDNTPDASLTTLAPSSNTTGSPVTFGAGATIPSGQTLAMAGAHISGGPTFDAGLTSTGGGITSTGSGGFLANASGGGIYETRYGAAWVGRMYADDASNLRLATYNGSSWVDALVLTTGQAVTTKNNTLDDGSTGAATFGTALHVGSLVPTGQNGLLDIDVGNTYDVYIHRAVATDRFRVGGGYTTNRQLVSTLATGTAPFSVASTTPVTNLVPDATASAPSFAGAMHAEDGSVQGPAWSGTEPLATTSGTSFVTGTAQTWTAPSGKGRYVFASLGLNGNNTSDQEAGYSIVNGTNGPTHSQYVTTGYTDYSDVFDQGVAGASSVSLNCAVRQVTGSGGVGAAASASGGKRIGLAVSAA